MMSNVRHYRRMAPGSPSNSTVISPPGQWRLAVLDLRTGQQTRLAEQHSVDDQPEWLDDQHILYGLPRAARHRDHRCLGCRRRWIEALQMSSYRTRVTFRGPAMTGRLASARPANYSEVITQTRTVGDAVAMQGNEGNGRTTSCRKPMPPTNIGPAAECGLTGSPRPSASSSSSRRLPRSSF